MATYQELLADPRWQLRREDILNRDGWECQNPGCPGTSNHLHVHHLWYASGRLPWQYPDEALITLCADCHEAQHAPRFSWFSWFSWITRPVFFLLRAVLIPCLSLANVLMAVLAAVLGLAALVFGFLIHLPGFPRWPMVGAAAMLLILQACSWALVDWIQGDGRLR